MVSFASNSCDKMVTDEELRDLAKEELLRDVKCAAMRAEQFGAHRWAKPKIMVANKRFLKHMILGGHRNSSEKQARDKPYEKATESKSRTRHSPDRKSHEKRKHSSKHKTTPELNKVMDRQERGHDRKVADKKKRPNK